MSYRNIINVIAMEIIWRMKIVDDENENEN